MNQKLKRCILGATAGATLLVSNVGCDRNYILRKPKVTLGTWDEPEFPNPTLTPKSKISAAERNLLAQMVYGEAGLGADPLEVIHTVLNRVSSPLFGDNITAVITQKGQYVGYKPSNPVTKEYRRMVDIAVDEWELNGCQPIAECPHFYFVTGLRGICNKFEISPDEQGSWVASKQKKYAKLRKYCPTAQRQFAEYQAEAADSLTRQ